MSRALLLAALALAATCAGAEAPIRGASSTENKVARQGKRTLLLVDDAAVERTHSVFLDGLRARGHVVTTKVLGALRDLAGTIVKHAVPQFDNVLLLAPRADIDAGVLTSFVDGGGNLLVAGGPDASDAVRDLAMAFNVEFDAPKARVTDHFSFETASDAGGHTRVLTNAYFASPFVVGPSLAASGAPSVVFEGTGLSADRANILVIRTLAASPTGYSAVPGEAVGDYPQSAGADTLLVVSVQTRSNARATFSGSLWALSNAAFATPASSSSSSSSSDRVANEAFFGALSAWTFQEAGVLRAGAVRHARADGRAPERQIKEGARADVPTSMYPDPEIATQSLVYRIKDDIVYKVDLSVFNGTAWVPYLASDVQLEFVMLDPYVRTSLKHDGASGTYTARLRAPDVYGVFHFRLHYRRAGLTTLYVADQVNVRPFLHNEYERFIFSAYPYYAAAASVMAGVFALAFGLLYTK